MSIFMIKGNVGYVKKMLKLLFIKLSTKWRFDIDDSMQAEIFLASYVKNYFLEWFWKY